MIRLYGIILIAFSFLISGCVQKTTNDNSSKVIEFGNKNNYINKITYINGDKSIIFYTDKKEYSKKFNLCDNKETYCNSYIDVFKTEDTSTPFIVSFYIMFSDNTSYEIRTNKLNYGLNVINEYKKVGFKVE